MPGQLSLQAGLNHTIPLDGNNRSFTKVSNTHYKIPVMPTYDCKYDQIVTTKYYNIHVQTYHSPLIGAASIIKQHLRKTPCSVATDTTILVLASHIVTTRQVKSTCYRHFPGQLLYRNKTCFFKIID